MHRRNFLKTSCAAGIIAWVNPGTASGLLPRRTEDLEAMFQNPPMDYWPQVFWFWMNGHISKDGITQDLEAMKKAGIGGVFQYDAGTGIPEGPVAFGSDAWVILKKHAIQEALRLDMELTLHNCPGWSASGGPWITPEMAMQQVTWSEMVVSGGRQVAIQLPLPFQKLGFYRDIAVLAFPASDGEAALAGFTAHTHAEPVSRELVTGEDPAGVVVQPSATHQKCWLQLSFPQVVEARSITFQVSALQTTAPLETFNFSGVRNYLALESSTDGINYSAIAQISTGLEADLQREPKFITYDFPAVRAKFFRLSTTLPRRLSQVRFSNMVRLEGFMEKAGFRFMYYEPRPTETFSGEAIFSNQVLDLTGKFSKEGKLIWDAPAGNWTLLRMGYTPTAAINKAAPAAGTGLECDKFNKEALSFHLQHALQALLPDLKLLAAKGKAGLEIDSYEAGMQNWTAALPRNFESKRGYSLIKYLPALTGRVVESPELTEQFLWDFRKTLSGMMAEHYYGHFSAWCKTHGFTAYIEPYDKGPFSEMQVGAEADVPMGEWWNGQFALLQGNLPIRRTPKLAASIAHTTGRQVVGAETFTAEPGSAKWQEYPFALKPVGDAAFIQGINKLVLHRFVHQPHPSALPGMTMGPWGSHIDRTNTWWHMSAPWFTYMARCQFLLRQGLFVADLLYLASEESAVFTEVERSRLDPIPPEGYAYDVVHADMLIQSAKVQGGNLVLQGGMRYRLLVISENQGLSLALLQKISALVHAGAILVGRKPTRIRGMVNAATAQTFSSLVEELWGTNGETIPLDKRVGKGRVIWGVDLQSLLQHLGIQRDFSCSSRSGDAPVSFIHRQTPEADIYFLVNARRSVEELVCTLRVKDRIPEVWDPATGRYYRVDIYEKGADGIRVPLQMEPCGALFMVLRKQPNRLPYHSLSWNGKTICSSQSFPMVAPTQYPQVINNFTVCLWVKPETDIMLQPSIHMEKVPAPYTDFYAVFPEAGSPLYGKGHATCGLAIGRNGIAIWENETGVPVLVLAAPAAISGWGHVAMVYQGGTPIIYLNGKRVMQGKQRLWKIHPSNGRVADASHFSFFNGDKTTMEIISRPLTDAEISKKALRSLPPLEEPFETINYNSGLGMLAWRNGNYDFKRANQTVKTIHVTGIPEKTRLAENWEVHFPQGSGAPASLVLPQLISFHLHSNLGVRFFSGTATYRKNFSMVLPNEIGRKRWFLDLGRVAVIASVKLNGKDFGVLWKRPLITEITGALHNGPNVLEVEVANLWPNRLIGDEQMPDTNSFEALAASGSFESLVGGGIKSVPSWYLQQREKPNDGRVTFLTWKHYQKDAPLLEGGLLGPVCIRCAVSLDPNAD